MSDPTALRRALEAVRRGRLYPAVILHGADAEVRSGAATTVARALLCEREAARRPCGSCHQCERIEMPAEKPPPPDPQDRNPPPFHPDFAVIWRDAKTVTSAEATRSFLRPAHSAPFEARGQVFVIAEAETLSPEAGDALLKLLEEPGAGAPRHFLLLAPSRLDLTATLRSRSQSIYLGAAERADGDEIAARARQFGAAVAAWERERNPLFLLEAAAGLAGGKEIEDLRETAQWSTAAAAVKQAAYSEKFDRRVRRRLIDLGLELLSDAPALRLRGIKALRILEGTISRHLAGTR